MTRKEARVKKIQQRIDENMKTTLQQYPKEIERWYTDNIIERSLSYLLAKTINDEYVPIEATLTNSLKVANVGGGFEKVYVKTGTATSTESDPITFPETVTRLRFVAVDYDMLFRPSYDGVHWQDQIYIFAQKDFQLDIVCHSFKVQRATANNATYRIEGYR